MKDHSDSDWWNQFEEAQRDPGFVAWLAVMEYQVEMFLTSDVTDMPADPYSEAGLDRAEATALAYFPSIEGLVESDRNRELADRFARFIGEAYVHGLGGHWVNVPPREESGATVLAVELPDKRLLEPFSLLTAAVHRRHGSVWSRVFRRNSSHN